MKNFKLNRAQLKLIAICAMVIDHTTWGFLDFYTPLAQVLHVIGRLTIPIMCFFIAEGFRKTSNLQKYITRLSCFAMVSIIPFYIFFHEEYLYRQNFFFDLLIGLLVLSTLENQNYKKYQKVLLTVLLFAISMTVGGWPVTPTCFILSFYYGKTFREKAKWFIISDVGTVLFLMATILLNNVYHFSHYEWVWWDKSYLLGFMLALPLLYRYNGEKGKDVGGRYFFYLFYPCHFLVLALIRGITNGSLGAYELYLIFHIATFVLCLIFVVLTLQIRPTPGQVSLLMFEVAACIYVFGFVLEILVSTPEAYFLAILVEYFGEFVVLLALTLFVRQLRFLSIPLPFFILQAVVSLIGMYVIMTTRETGIFYHSIGVDTSGPFPHVALDYGPGFYLMLIYIGFMSLLVVYACAKNAHSDSKLDVLRVRCLIIAIVIMWLPYGIKVIGLTGGYEIPALGIAGSGLFLYLALVRYGFLDSVALASENALDHGPEAILVLDRAYQIIYHNKQIDQILGNFSHAEDLRNDETLGAIISGEMTQFKKDGRIYDIQLDPLMEGGFQQGLMIWLIDATDHYAAIEQVREYAIRDSLTGLFNRVHFIDLVDQDLSEGHGGTFLMIDLDNFKRVNDTYGHQVGDQVLCAVAECLSSYSEEAMYSCRIGGDEFCAFFRGKTDRDSVSAEIYEIMTAFHSKLNALNYPSSTSMSVGAVIEEKGIGATSSSLYAKSDEALYEAKSAGKNRLCFR